jgi:AraC family transcriptional regulator, transcriptional activator of pobA
MEQYFKIFKFNNEDAIKVANSTNEPHIHNFEELLVGAEGKVEHFIDFKVLTFKAPFISFITQGKMHRIRPMMENNKCNIWGLRFNSEFLPESTFRLYSYYHDHANIELKDGNCFNRMNILCEMMYEEMQRPDPKLAVVHDLLKTLFTMIETERDRQDEAESSIPYTQNTTFKNFLRILEDNFRRSEGVDYYSEKLFMSSRNLNLICQSILHKSVSEIIETRKLIEAQNLLIYSDKSISEIGFELGYNEKAYFTSFFKKKIGQTPTEFRNEISKLIT